MATMALPSQSFADIQRYYRQKKATGATVSPRETRLAWQGYWDAMSSRQFQGQELGLRERGLELSEKRFESDEAYRNEQLRMQRQAQRDAESAAKISGYSSAANTLITGGMLAKGTKLGGYIGMGPTATATPGTGVPVAGTGAAPTPAASAAGPIIGGSGVSTGLTAGAELGAGTGTSTGLTAGAELGMGTGGGTAAGTSGVAGAGAVGLGTAGAGLGVGYAAASIPIGKGKSAGVAKGAIAGAAVGTMIMPGAGTIVGAVFGAMGGFIKEAK